MTIATAMDYIVSQMVLAVPPDRLAKPYRDLGDLEEVDSFDAIDRGFVLLPPIREEVTGETEDNVLVRWSVQVELYLSRAGRARSAFLKAIAEETQVLYNAFETATTWPAGVAEYITQPARVTADREGAVITIAFDLRTEE